MQIRNIILICFCLLIFKISGQEQIYFNKRIDYINTYDESKCIVSDINGYVIFGITTDSVYDYFAHYTFTKTDSSGNTQWVKVYGDSYNEYFPGNPGSLIKANSENWYACGYERVRDEENVTHCGYLLYLDSNFDTIWSKSFCERTQPYDTVFVFKQIKQCEEGDLVFAGERYIPGVGSDIWLLKTDSLGKKLWERFFSDGTKIQQGHSVIQTTDGGFAIGGYKYNPGDSDSGDPLIIKTDSLGNEEWTLNPGTQYADNKAMLALSHDGYIIAATNFATEPHGDNREAKPNILKIGNDGSIIFNRKYGNSQYDNYLNQLLVLSNGDIMTTGIYSNYEPQMPTYLGWILCVDSSSNQKWYREYMNLKGDHSHNYLRDILQTNDNGFIACGQVYPSAPDTGTPDIWVLKLDSLGYDTSTVGINEKIPYKGVNLHIYPNPVTGEFTLTIDKPAKEELSVSFYNLYGLKVKDIEIPKSEQSVKVNASNWQSGLYVTVARQQGKVVGKGKFVVRK